MAKADRYTGGRFSKASLANNNTDFDSLGKNWAKWVKTWRNWFICSIWLLEGRDEPDIELYLPARENYLPKSLSIVLTQCTEAEIICIRQLFNEMFDLAQPICKIRDEKAAARYEAGEDVDKRLYREVPKLFTRAWAKGIDGQSLLQRLEELPSAKRLIAARNERIRNASNELAEHSKDEPSTGDDDAAPSELEGLQ